MDQSSDPIVYYYYKENSLVVYICSNAHVKQLWFCLQCNISKYQYSLQTIPKFNCETISPVIQKFVRTLGTDSAARYLYPAYQPSNACSAYKYNAMLFKIMVTLINTNLLKKSC